MFLINKKRKESNLTLVYLCHENFKENIKYFNYLYSNLNGKIELYFAFDNVLPIKYVENFYKNFPNSKLHKGPNKGKLLTIFDISKFIETDFFKIIDGDNSVWVKGLLKLLPKLNKINNNVFVQHKISKLFHSDKFWGLKLFEDSKQKAAIKISREVNWLKISNSSLILNTEPFKNSNVNLRSQKFYSDNLMSMYLDGIFKKIAIINKKFYIQNHKFGQTNSNTKNFDEKYDSLLLLYENLNTLKESNKDFNLDFLSYDFKQIIVTELKQIKVFMVTNPLKKNVVI